MSGKSGKASLFATLPPVAGAAIVVSFTMYPVDVVRAFCMAHPGMGASAGLSAFLNAHGFKGFIKKGMVAELSRATFSRGIKFWLQPIVHENLFHTDQSRGTPLTKGFAGALATFPEVMVISPLENLKIAEQLDKDNRFRSISDTARHLYKTRGLFGGFYIGYLGVQMRQVLWTGGFFLSLDEFKRAVSSGISQPIMQDVLSGFGAGVFGTGLCCWCDVVRSVIQKNAIADTFDTAIARPSALNHVNPMVFFGEASKLHAEKGVRGLYAGGLVKCVHMGGSGALLAVLMPRFKKWWSS